MAADRIRAYISSGNAFIDHKGSGSIIFRTNGTERMRIAANGELVVSGSVSLQSSTAANAVLSYTGTNARTYTIPSVGATAEFVMTDGNQTITGTKTFNSLIQGTSTFATRFSSSAVTLWGQSFDGSADISGNLVVDGTVSVGTQVNKVTLTYTANTVRRFTFPTFNTGFVFSEGNQTIAGVKTFTSNIIGNVTSAARLAQVRTLWGQNYDGSANVGGDMTNVRNLIINSSTITYTSNVARTYTLGGALSVVGNFVMTEGTQSILDTRRFSGRLIGKKIPILLDRRMLGSTITISSDTATTVFSFNVTALNTTGISTTSTIYVVVSALIAIDVIPSGQRFYSADTFSQLTIGGVTNDSFSKSHLFYLDRLDPGGGFADLRVDPVALNRQNLFPHIGFRSITTTSNVSVSILHQARRITQNNPMSVKILGQSAAPGFDNRATIQVWQVPD